MRRPPIDVEQNRSGCDPEVFHDSYQDDQIPAYTDIASVHSDSLQDEQLEEEESIQSPDPLWSTHNLGYTEIYTRHPIYSHNEDALYALINQQVSYPPSYYVQIHGKHTEVRQETEERESRKEIVDFYFRVDISHLLGPRGSGEVQFLPDNKRGYRGTRYPCLKPVLNELERRDSLFEWCKRYVDDQSCIKSFTLTRKIRNHDTQKLYRLIRTAIQEIRYRGQLYITFPLSHCKLIVYSPGRINELRTKIWVRWLFYISFLWIFAWPLVFLLTSRYETVKCVFYYANSPDSNDPNRICKVMSEDDWFQSWKRSIKRAALEGINTGNEGILCDDYRMKTERLMWESRVARSDNAFSHGESSFHDRMLNISSIFEVSDWSDD